MTADEITSPVAQSAPEWRIKWLFRQESKVKRSLWLAEIENTAAMSVQPELEDGKTTVGMMISVSHIAATPLGMEVRIETELTEVAPNGKVMTFKATCYDEAGLIGEGTHQRAIVDRARFEAKANAKSEQ